MNIQLAQTNELQYKLTWLDDSYFDQLYNLERNAAEELVDNYVLKSKTFVRQCLNSGFCCGFIGEDNKLITFLMTDLLQGSNHGYAEVLGHQHKEHEKFLFREGDYVLPSFRRRGLAKSMAQFLNSHPEFRNIHSVYTAISPINYPNLGNSTKSGFVLRRFYHTISGGRLRYLIQYWPNQTFEKDSSQKIPSENHDRQRELFAQNYVGVEVILENKNTFILFKKPSVKDWYKQKL
jgi:hypothetical protein